MDQQWRMTTTLTQKWGVPAQFIGAHPLLTLGGAFQDDDDDNKDDYNDGTIRDEEHDEDIMARSSMFEMLCPPEDKAHPVGSSSLLLSDGSPKAPIIGDDRGESRRGGSIADEMTTDGVRMTATTERGIH